MAHLQLSSGVRQQSEFHITPLTNQKQIVGLAGWLVVSFIAAAIGGAASIQAGPFYAQLVRPDWAPPGSIFGPVWTALYALMGIAAWLVWRVDGFRAARFALILFLAQLTLNALWSWLFFGWHRGALAFADILLLWVSTQSAAPGVVQFLPDRSMRPTPLRGGTIQASSRATFRSRKSR